MNIMSANILHMTTFTAINNIQFSDGRFGKKENNPIPFNSAPQTSQLDSIQFDSSQS